MYQGEFPIQRGHGHLPAQQQWVRLYLHVCMFVLLGVDIRHNLHDILPLVVCFLPCWKKMLLIFFNRSLTPEFTQESTVSIFESNNINNINLMFK